MFLIVCAALAMTPEARSELDPATPPVRNGKAVSFVDVGTAGLAATVTSTQGGDANDRLGSLSLSVRHVGFAYDDGLDVVDSTTLELGGTVHDHSLGFHGGGTLLIAGGYRFHVTDASGPFVRGGAEAVLRGDPLVYQSMAEVPQLQIGYQSIKGRTFFEAAGRSGFVLSGRSETGDLASRHLDQVLDIGATAVARIGPTLFVGEWSHFLARGPGGAVDWLTVSLCGIKRPLAVCTDVRTIFSDVGVAPGEVVSARVAQVGITIGSSRK